MGRNYQRDSHSNRNSMVAAHQLDRSKAGACLYLVLLLAGTAFYAYKFPLYTWDLVPYVATAIESSELDPVALHGATYSHLEQTHFLLRDYEALVAGALCFQNGR